MSAPKNIMSRYFLCLSASILIYDRFSLSIYAISDIPRDLSRYQVIKVEDKDAPRITFHIKADVCNNTTQLCRIKLSTYEAGQAYDKCKFCVQNQSCISSSKSKSCSCMQSENGDIIYYNDTVDFAASNIQIFFWLATTVSSLETEKPVETVFVIRESEAKQVVELPAPDVRCSCPGIIAITTVSVLSAIVVVIVTTFIIRRSNKTKGQSSNVQPHQLEYTNMVQRFTFDLLHTTVDITAFICGSRRTMTTMAKTSEYFLMFVTLWSLLHNTLLMTDATSDIPRDLSRYQVIKAEDKDEPRVTFHIKADVCNNTSQLCRIKLTTYEAGQAIDKCKFCVQNQSCISSSKSQSCSCIQSEEGDIIYYNSTVNFTASNIQIFFWFATTVGSIEREKPVETVFVIRQSGAKIDNETVQKGDHLSDKCSCLNLLLIIVPCACVVIDVTIGVICIVRRRRKTREARVPVGDPFLKESLDMVSKDLDREPRPAQSPGMMGSHLHHEPHPRGSLNVSGKKLDQDSHRKSAPSKLLYHEPHKKESLNSPNKQVPDHGDIRDSTTDDSYDHLQRA